MADKLKPAEPFQFGLWSLFVVTSAIAVAFGVLNELGPGPLVGFLIVSWPILISFVFLSINTTNQ